MDSTRGRARAITVALFFTGCGARSDLLDDAPAAPTDGAARDSASHRDSGARDATLDARGVVDSPTVDRLAPEADGPIARDGFSGDSHAADAKADASADANDAAPDAGCPSPPSITSGTALWALSNGATYPTGFALGPEGRIVVIGEDGSPNQGFVAAWNGAGSRLFMVPFQNTSGAELDNPYQIPFGIAVTGDSSAYVVGRFSGTIVFPGTPPGTLATGPPVGGVSPVDMFLVKLDSAGQHVWSERFASSTEVVGTAVALDPAGNIIVAGNGADPFDLLDAGTASSFVAKLTSSGVPIWTGAFNDDDGYAYLRSIAVDAAGNVYIADGFAGSLFYSSSAGGGDAGASLGACPTRAICGYVAKINAGGQLAWIQVFPAPTPTASDGLVRDDETILESIAVDPTGNPAVVGYTILSTATGNTYGRLIAKMDTASGEMTWTITGSASAGTTGDGIACDSAGDLFVGMGLQGPVTFAELGGSVTFPSGDAGFSPDAAFTVEERIGPDGGLVWARTYPGGALSGVAVNSCATELAVGGLAFGSVSLPRAGDAGSIVIEASDAEPTIVGRLVP